MAENDFEKTVKLSAGAPSQDQTVKLTPNQDKTANIPIPEVNLPAIDPLSSEDGNKKLTPIKIGGIVILVHLILGGAWYGVPQFLMKKAMSDSAAGNHADAAKQLGYALYLFPLKSELYLTALGKEQRLSNDLAGAQASLEKALKVKPDFYEAARELGLTCNAQGQSQRAFDLLSKCYKTNPNDKEILTLAAQLSIDLKDFKSAAELYKTITKSGGDAEDFQKLGIALHETGKDDEAVPSLEQAVQKNKNLKSVSGLLAKIYLKQEKHEKAIAAAESEIALVPNDAEMSRIIEESSLKAAQDAINAKNYSQAESFIETGLKFSSTEKAHFHYELARISALQKKKNDVFKHLLQAAALDKSLKAVAKKDGSFAAYKQTPQFKKIVK